MAFVPRSRATALCRGIKTHSDHLGPSLQNLLLQSWLVLPKLGPRALRPCSKICGACFATSVEHSGSVCAILVATMICQLVFTCLKILTHAQTTESDLTIWGTHFEHPNEVHSTIAGDRKFQVQEMKIFNITAKRRFPTLQDCFLLYQVLYFPIQSTSRPS